MANTTHNIKQHDTHPPLIATLKDATGTVIDLTTASTVSLIAKTQTGAVSWSGDCAIDDAAGGIVSYSFTGVTDTSTVNTYQAEFEITWSNGKITTIPTVGYFSIVVGADLG